MYSQNISSQAQFYRLDIGLFLNISKYPKFQLKDIRPFMRIYDPMQFLPYFLEDMHFSLKSSHRHH